VGACAPGGDADAVRGGRQQEGECSLLFSRDGGPAVSWADRDDSVPLSDVPQISAAWRPVPDLWERLGGLLRESGGLVSARLPDGRLLGCAVGREEHFWPRVKGDFLAGRWSWGGATKTGRAAWLAPSRAGGGWRGEDRWRRGSSGFHWAFAEPVVFLERPEELEGGVIEPGFERPEGMSLRGGSRDLGWGCTTSALVYPLVSWVP